MTKIKSVRKTVYETSDGEQFDTHTAAVEYDIQLQIQEMIQATNPAPQGDMPDHWPGMSASQMAKWILNRRESLGSLLRRATQATKVRISKPRGGAGVGKSAKLPPLRPIPPGTYNAEVVRREGGMAVFRLCDRPFIGREVFMPMRENMIEGTINLITLKHGTSTGK